MDAEFSIPDMPEEFWPEMLVTAKYKGRELCCALTKAGSASIPQSVEALRFALWQEASYKEYLAIKSLTSSTES